MKIKIPEYIRTLFDKYKYILFVCLAGILLVLLPSGGKKTENASLPSYPASAEYDVESLERKAEEIFSKINGVGKVSVSITLKSGYETVYAYDEDLSVGGGGTSESIQRTVVSLNNGSREEPLALKIKYPEYSGAVIVCEGGDNAKIKLTLTQAMKSLTGITSENIVIAKMKD